MALTVTDNSVRQINAALLSLEKEINETNSEKAQDKQIVQVELKNAQYSFLAPLRQNGTSVSIDTTGTWQGNANSATTASSASTALNADHATTADTATTATNADISKTLDTVNGDKLQIGTGTAINVTNAQHAASADSASSATTATSASNANLSITADTTNGDKIQIGTGTAVNITNSKHAATVDTTSSVTSGSNTPITSGGVFTALNGFIKSKDVNVGTVTIPSSNYYEIALGLSANDTVISAKAKYWSTNTGCFSLVTYDQNRLYLVADSGVTVNGLQVTVYYI